MRNDPTAARVVSAAVLACIAGVAGVVQTAAAQPTFRAIAPDAGFDYAVIQDVSADGSKVLVSLQTATPGPQLFSYVLDLATNARVDIQNSGSADLIALALDANGDTVVGYIGGGPLGGTLGFVWTPEEFTILDGLPDGNLHTPTGVSADGSVVAGNSGANFGDGYQQAWRWTRAGGFVALDDIGTDVLTFSGTGRLSDDASTLVGFGTIGDFDPDTDDFQRGAVWPNGGAAVIDIGILPNPFNLGIQGTSVSADGSVVFGFGAATGPGGSFANRAFRWTQATGTVELPGIPLQPSASVYVTDCTADGSTAVGYIIDGGVSTWEAVVWTEATGFRTLRSILASGGVSIPNNIRLRETYVSNDGRVIAGWAYNTTTQRYLGYVATLPGPCRVDFNNDGELTFDDIQLFVSAYNAQQTSADFNNDGEWTFDDIQAFVAQYNAGC
jgi:uncharacterized membrane protein